MFGLKFDRSTILDTKWRDSDPEVSANSTSSTQAGNGIDITNNGTKVTPKLFLSLAQIYTLSS